MEQVNDQQWICSQCSNVISDEIEYIDNKGVCDECYSNPFKKRVKAME